MNPNLRVRLNMATGDVDLHREVTDVAIGTIKTDQKPDAEIYYEKLFTSHLFPVCSPSLLESESIGGDYELLKQQTILRFDTWSDDWAL